jgi:hypothetical protein
MLLEMPCFIGIQCAAVHAWAETIHGAGKSVTGRYSPGSISPLNLYNDRD